MEKTRDLVKKLEIPRDNFMQRWLDKERNSMDLTEAEDIKKRWQEYTEELYKKKSSQPRISRWCDQSPRARHPGM